MHQERNIEIPYPNSKNYCRITSTSDRIKTNQHYPFSSCVPAQLLYLFSSDLIDAHIKQALPAINNAINIATTSFSASKITHSPLCELSYVVVSSWWGFSVQSLPYELQCLDCGQELQFAWLTLLLYEVISYINPRLSISFSMFVIRIATYLTSSNFIW